MSISREEFANRQQTDEEQNVLDVIDKILKKRDAEIIKQQAIFKDAVHEMGMAIKESGQDQSSDSEILTKELRELFEQSQSKEVSQMDLGLMIRKLSDIEAVLEHSDNISGVEMDHMKNLVNLTRTRIKEDKSNSVLMGALSDSVKYTVDNAVDVTSLASGLFSDSPLVMFLTKTLGDLGKSIIDKRREVREEKNTRLAEQLNEHQQRAYDQRKDAIKKDEKEKKGEKDDKPQKVMVDGQEVVKVEVVSPDIDISQAELPESEQIIKVEQPEIITEVPENAPLERIESDPELNQIQNIADTEEDETLFSLMKEQQLTNKLLEQHLDFMMTDSIDSLEEDKEKAARDEKLMRLFGKKDKKAPLEKKGFLSSLLDNIPGVAMLGPAITGLGTFITGTLVPTITGFLGTLSTLIIPILAGAAIVTSLISAVSNFFSAEEILGKAEGEYASLSERIGVFIGGIMEGFASIADFVAGILGFDTDLKGWWRENFTIPLANFLENFSISDMIGNVKDYIANIPDMLLENAKTGLSFLWEYSPYNLFFKGLKFLSDKFDVKGKLATVNEKINEFFDNFDLLDLILGPFDDIYRMVDEKFNVSDKIKDILAPLDLAGLINKMKDSILSFIPDFLLSDEQKERKISLETEEKRAEREQEALVDRSKDFVKKDLVDRKVVDHDMIGPSEIIDWKAVREMGTEELKMMIAFDDWDQPTQKRLNELQAQKAMKEVPTPSPTLERQKLAMLSDKKQPEQQKSREQAINIEIVPPKQQPMIAHRIGQTTTIDNYQKAIEMAENTKNEMPPMPVVNQTQQINSHASFNVPAIPYNQEKGIRDLSASFAV